MSQRELDLRGNKIGVIENLGATEDQHASINLSDNEIVKLESFPHLKSLTTLLVNNNRIARINPNIGGFSHDLRPALPKLETLVLTNNRLSNLATLVNLQNLCLPDNVVTKRPNYRLYFIHKLPELRLLDFKKVKLNERQEAKKLFATENCQPAQAPPPPLAKTFVPGESPSDSSPETIPVEVEEPSRKRPTPEQIIAIKTAIANFQTLEEVAGLENALKLGLPLDVVQPGDDASRISSTETSAAVPLSSEHSEAATALEEVLFSLPCAESCW